MKQSILFLLILSACAVAGHTQVRNAQVPTHFVTSISNDAPTNFAGVVADANLIASGSATSSGPLTLEQQLILEDILYSAPLFVRQWGRC